MSRAWPETILFGHSGVSLENGRKTGFPQGGIAEDFGQPFGGTKTVPRTGL